MRIIVTGKNLEIGESLRQHVETATKTIVDRYFGDVLEIHVNLSKDHSSFICDISAHISRHFVVRSHFEGNDPYRSFDQALDKMELRIQRYRSRLRNRKRHGTSKENEIHDAALQYVINGSAPIHEEEEIDTPIIIAEIDVEVPTISVSDAVMQMDLTEQPVMMFRNTVSGSLSVIYRRADGNIGWIDPTIPRSH